tara:strand:+ start:708 stop:977 length:270 start_codon:yes stop_codon:yes gene_type:complete
VLRIPKNLLNANPTIEKILTNGYVNNVKIAEFNVDAKENLKNSPLACNIVSKIVLRKLKQILKLKIKDKLKNNKLFSTLSRRITKVCII